MIIGVNGSPRKGGNSEYILGNISRQFSPQEFKIVNLRELNFGPCIACEKCRKTKGCTGLDDDMTPLYRDIEASSGLVLVSPTHNYNITALMKSFIDRLYCFYEFDPGNRHIWKSRLAGQGKKALLVAVCEQEREEDMGVTMPAMCLPVKALGYSVEAEFPVFGVFKKAAVDNSTVNSIVELAVEIFRKE